MAKVDFQTLYYQISGQWQAIGSATPSERRLLILELTQALAGWEAEEDAPLENSQTLCRIGYWSALGQTVGTQIQGIVGQLGENKPVLRERLREIRDEIAAAEVQVQQLQPEVAALETELAAAESQLMVLRQKQAALSQQLESLKTLRQLEEDVERAQVGVDDLAVQLQQGDDPGGALAKLVTLSEMLLAYYQAYLAADRDIAHHLLSSEANKPPSATLSRMLQVPERLMVLDGELKTIDRVLTERLQEQDARDREVKARG